MSLKYRFVWCLLAMGLSALALSCGLTEMLQGPSTTPTETVTPSPQPTGTATPTVAVDTATATPTPTPRPPDPPSQTPEVTDTPTPSNTPAPPTPTNTPTPSPTLKSTATPQPTETLPGLRIESFDVELRDTATGKMLTCTWNTTGATGVRLVVGTSQRFPPWHEGPPDGSATFELATTLYDRPDVTLTAFGEGGGEAIETVVLDWPCTHTYFFAGSGVEVPRICPTSESAVRQGAQQPFQGGSMIWIPDIEGRDVIFVLYSSGSWQIYDDTWDGSQPESDPSIVPPAGLHQPIRGFGKVWREHPEVQSGLNWATAPEAAVAVTYQRQAQESIGGVRYVQVAGKPLVRLTGLGGSGSTWTHLP